LAKDKNKKKGKKKEKEKLETKPETVVNEGEVVEEPKSNLSRKDFEKAWNRCKLSWLRCKNGSRLAEQKSVFLFEGRDTAGKAV